MFSSEFGFRLPVSFHQCSILNFIYTSLLPEVQKGEAWDSYKMQCSFGNWGTFDRKTLSLFRLNRQYLRHGRAGFFTGTVHVRVVLGKMIQWLPPSALIYKLYINALISIPLLSEGQAGEYS
jgi:hypothetical protein